MNELKVYLTLDEVRKPQMVGYRITTVMTGPQNLQKEPDDGIIAIEFDATRTQVSYLAVLEASKMGEKSVPILILLEDPILLETMKSLTELHNNAFKSIGSNSKRAHWELLRMIFIATQHRSISFAAVRTNDDKRLVFDMHKTVQGVLKRLQKQDDAR